MARSLLSSYLIPLDPAVEGEIFSRGDHDHGVVEVMVNEGRVVLGVGQTGHQSQG